MRPPSSRRAVITGAGIVSCIGNDLDTVSNALREGRSGIQPAPAYREMGLRSQVAGRIHLDCAALIGRRIRRFMNDGSMYAYVAMGDAITDAGLDADAVSDPRTGLIVGTGGASPANLIAAADAAPASMPRSSATAPLQTAPIWSRRRVKARCAACGMRWNVSTRPSII